MLLENKTVLITGSSQGIGKAIAYFCHSQGANVMLHGRDEECLQSIVNDLGERVAYICIDLLTRDVEKILIQATIEAFGGLTGLVNNAGIFPRTTLEEVNLDNYDKIMSVNCKLPLLLTQEAVKVFKQNSQAGSIVNIGSINAYCGQSDLLIYSMSKGALMTMTRNLADSLSESNIRVNQLNVGWTATETEHAVKQSEGLGENWQQTIPKPFAPQGKILKPEQIAPHVAFWLSELSAPCTGAVYEIEQYPIIGRNLINKFHIGDTPE